MSTNYYGNQNGFANEPRLNSDGECKGINCDGEHAFLPTEENFPAVEPATHINEIYPPQEVVTEDIGVIPKPEEPVTQKELVQWKNRKYNVGDFDWPRIMRLPKSSFNYFPIIVRGASRGRSGGVPSGATAIANSFSTGKGGVATSRATAYGDSSALRNLNDD